jgi:hypothetical protein
MGGETGETARVGSRGKRQFRVRCGDGNRGEENLIEKAV